MHPKKQKEVILPVIAYGHPILRKVCTDMDLQQPERINTLIEDMWETMYNANGVGLAAPQVGHAKRLFVVDTLQLFESMDEQDQKDLAGQQGIKEVFINAQINYTDGEPYEYNEGCLSIPGVREDVMRDEIVEIEYYDGNYEKQVREYSGVTARVILHEYDHIDGRLFVDYIKPLKKKLLQKRLKNISKGNIDVPYKMKYS